MHINGISQNTTLQIVIKVNRQEMYFDTKLIQAYHKQLQPGMYCIGCTPVLKDGKAMAFGSYPMQLMAHDNENGRDYKWNIDMHGFNKDRTQFLLFSKESTKPINHRGAMRIPCRYKIVAMVGNNRYALDGVAYDISTSGIGILMSPEYTKNIEVNDRTSISIYADHGHVKRVNGNVARIVNDFTQGKVLIGVHFDKLPAEIGELILNLQRKKP